MAIVILGPGGDWNLLGDEDWFYQYTEFSDRHWKSTSVTYTDGDGDRVVLSGSNLAESGVVTEVLIEDSEGRTIMEFTGLSVSATTVGNALENETAANFAIVENFLPLLLAGDDGTALARQFDCRDGGLPGCDHLWRRQNVFLADHARRGLGTFPPRRRADPGCDGRSGSFFRRLSRHARHWLCPGLLRG